MEAKKAKVLLKKYLEGGCTEREKALLESWYLRQNPEGFPGLSDTDRLKDMQQIRSGLEKICRPERPTNFKRSMAVAAVLIVFLASASGLYLYTQKNDPPSERTTRYMNDIEPGGNKAILTLENGSIIKLRSDKEGIAVSGDTLRYEDGTGLSGIDRRTNSKTPAHYATLRTPVGGQYRIVLSDGTRVWLNAASELRYPLEFTKSERTVEITGEAYFEVAPEEKTPFRVRTPGQEVEVLGTHFNISAYRDEEVSKTTLLEGAVKVSSGGYSKFLVPGQQAQIASQQIKVVDEVDTEEAVAWKNGYFKFNGNIEGIMNQLARWYNVEVIYHDEVNLSQTFSGEISKTRKLSELLDLMEITGKVHFEIEGRRVTVMP